MAKKKQKTYFVSYTINLGDEQKVQNFYGNKVVEAESFDISVVTQLQNHIKEEFKQSYNVERQPVILFFEEM